MEPEPARDDRDEPLLRAFLRGEPAACRRVERWAWEIIHFKPYGIPHDEREDLVQQVVTGVWQAASRKDFRLRRGLRPFVRHVAMARCVDWLRRLRDTVEVDETLRDPRPGPAEIVAERRRAEQVLAVLERMDAPCRELIHDHIFLDRSYAEIARRLGRPEVTLRVRMYNCLKAVRRMLAPT
jgi:RNA polymerase sigma factor (sigma-70 family)